MVGSALVGRANRSRRPGSIVGITTALVGLSFAGLAFVRSAPAAYLLMGVLGAAIILGEVVSTTVLQRLLSAEVLGRIFGIQGTIIYSAILVGSLVAPVLVTSFGLGPSLVIARAVSVVTVAAATTRLLAVDRATPAYLDDIASPMSLLQSLPIFHGAPAAGLEAMARSCSRERVPNGQIIIREGDSATDFFVVVSGALVVLSSGEESGQKKVVNRLGEGDYFGEIGLLERIPRTATVQATEDSIVYRISGDSFLDAVTPAPVISGVLLGGVMRGLARTHPFYRPTTPPTTASTGAPDKDSR